MKNCKTIIIGAGISGIGCATRLLEARHDFKIISPSIGGRILESDSDTVEYGAYYAMSVYSRVSKYISRGRRIKYSSMVFHRRKKSYKLFAKRFIPYIFQLVKLVLILIRFRFHYQRYKTRAVKTPQLECIRQDGYLKNLYEMNAHDFVVKHGIHDIVYDYLAEVLHGTAFTSIKNLNAFTFLQFSLPLILPVYEFVFNKKKVEEALADRWECDVVKSVVKDKASYIVRTKKGGEFRCKNLIVATEPHVAKKLLKHSQTLRGPVSAQMFHVLGEIRSDWNDGECDLFEDESRMLAIARQKDSSYLFYSVHENPDFNKYFFHHKIIRHKHWQPAFHIQGSNTVDFKHDDGLYVIGDNNVCGMEDSFIYGLCAANTVLG